MKTVSVVDIELTPDYSAAKIYISVLGNSVERRYSSIILHNQMFKSRN